MQKKYMIQGVQLRKDLIFSCVEVRHKTRTFDSGCVGGFDRRSLRSQKQPVSFKGRVQDGGKA